MKRKIALVNQRYGIEVNGGSELHCRQLAEKLLKYYDVEILTTCALDYITWDNYYKEGVEVINGVKVRRFKTSKSRNIKAFNKLSDKVLTGSNNTIEEEIEWINEQGPYCPDFIDYIKNNSHNYDAIIYMTYLYYLTAIGTVNTANKNIYLLPTAHDEAPIYLNYYRNVFNSARGFIYNTIEEKNFICSRFPVSHKPHVIAGVGVELPNEDIPDIREKLNFKEDYILYIGRIDESKGCGILFDYFQQYKKNTNSNIKLVLIGKSVMNIPKNKDIISLGFVDDLTKFAAIKGSKLLVLASKYESLSMVVLESMMMERPVLVNGECEVLKGHCIKSKAGLYFKNYNEFEEQLNNLLNSAEIYNEMKKSAKKYVDNNYNWDIITNKIDDMLEQNWKEDEMPIDIQSIMKDIKSKIEKEGLTEDIIDLKDVSIINNEVNLDVFEIDKLIYYMNNVNVMWDIQAYRNLPTQPGLIGKTKVFIKKVIRKLTKFYIEPIVEDQRAFNSNVVNSLNQIKNYIIEQNKK